MSVKGVKKFLNLDDEQLYKFDKYYITAHCLERINQRSIFSIYKNLDEVLKWVSTAIRDGVYCTENYHPGLYKHLSYSSIKNKIKPTMYIIKDNAILYCDNIHNNFLINTFVPFTILPETKWCGNRDIDEFNGYVIKTFYKREIHNMFDANVCSKPNNKRRIFIKDLLYKDDIK